MNHNLNIGGASVNKINTVLRYVLIHFRKRANNEIFSTIRLIPGELPFLPNNKVEEKQSFYIIESYHNFFDQNGNPLLVEPVYNGNVYYADTITVDVPKRYADLRLTYSTQSMLAPLNVIANERVFFKVSKEDNYMVTVESHVIGGDDGKLLHECSFKITGLNCSPGQTSIVPVIFEVYKDQSCSLLMGSCPVNLRIFHESMGNSD